MSPASKSKSKDKSTPKAGKERSKISMKPSTVHSQNGNGSPAGAYNPVMGTFHTLEISSSSSEPQSNGRCRTIDDPDDHSVSSPGTSAEYDSLSTNGSCSGESEDQKEKPTAAPPHTETILGSDNDKRGKIRQKNEKKHQRQRERRAQELYERCIAFLTSRKLEVLSHQLVVMGFNADRATMAIIVNEGRMEESVAWLLHEGEEDNKQQVSVNVEDKSCIKIDITDELARIVEIEVKYKCSRQDVERAIVSCEGDLLKAEENMRVQKQAVSAAGASKLDDSADSMELNDKEATPNKTTVLIRSPMKGASTTVITQQQRRDERDFNHSKTMTPGTSPLESANRNPQQSLKRILPKPTDWSRAQVTAVDKRWLTTSTPVSLASPVQVSGPTAKLDAQFAATMGHELKTSFQAGALKEPLVVMQRPKQKLPSSSIGMSVSPPVSAGWYSSGAPCLDILTAANSGMGHTLAGMGRNGSTLQQLYPQNNLQPLPPVPAELSASAGWSDHSWNVSGTTSSPLTTPSSLGLFTGWGLSGSSESSSQNDWNSCGSTPHRDYTSIDWSLDLTPRRPSMKIDVVSDTWSTMFMGGNATRPLMKGGGGVYLPGLHEVSGLFTDPSASANSQEWTSPFEGRDLFRVPRQYVTSPSMY